MSSSTCCSACGPNTYECHWNCDHCDLSVKTNMPRRRKREFTPDELKDENYWMKRSRNNEAAKRSRERRRMEERLLEERALQLLRENEKLKAALSAMHYHSVGKESVYDTVTDYPSIRELPQDSYLRSVVNFPGAHCVPHYAVSGRCDFSSAYDSGRPQGRQSFPASPAPALDDTQTHRYLGMHAPSDGNVSSSVFSNVPYAITSRKWGHPTMNLYPISAPWTRNELGPGYQGPAGVTPRCTAHARMNEPCVEQCSFMTGPKDICKEMELGKKAEHVSTMPLLPHKLRYKVNQVRHGEKSLPGIPR